MQINQFRQLAAALLGKHYGFTLADAGLADASNLEEILQPGESVYQWVSRMAEKLEWTRIDQRGPYQGYYQYLALTAEDELSAWQSQFPTLCESPSARHCSQCGGDSTATPAQGPLLVWRHCANSACGFTALTFQSSQDRRSTQRMPSLPRSLHLTWVMYSPSKDRYWSNDFGWCFLEEASRWSFPGLPDTELAYTSEDGGKVLWLSLAEAAHEVVRQLRVTHEDTLFPFMESPLHYDRVCIHGVRDMTPHGSERSGSCCVIDDNAPEWFSVYVVERSGRYSVVGDFGSLLRASAFAHELSTKLDKPVSPYLGTLTPTSPSPL